MSSREGTQGAFLFCHQVLSFVKSQNGLMSVSLYCHRTISTAFILTKWWHGTLLNKLELHIICRIVLFISMFSFYICELIEVHHSDWSRINQIPESHNTPFQYEKCFICQSIFFLSWKIAFCIWHWPCIFYRMEWMITSVPDKNLETSELIRVHFLPQFW